MEPIQELQAQANLWNLIFKHIDSMSLKCAVELGVPDAIHRHGRPISLSDLSAALSLPPVRVPHFARLMRLLCKSGVFFSDEKGEQVLYRLTPVSQLLVNDEGRGGSQSPFVASMLGPIIMMPFQFMGKWFRGDETATAFSAAHGSDFWDVAGRDLGFGDSFNAAMACDSRFISDILVRNFGDLFRGLTSLVDVGGGVGSTALAISEAFPDVKCSVLELAQVVEKAQKDNNQRVEFFAGDMFQFVPPANAVLLKWILHAWNDEDCVKILRRCKEAIPSRDGGGKVIIIDLVVGSSSNNSYPNSLETQLYFDMLMMVTVRSIEREEHQWRKIFVDAGFTDYKIMPSLGLRSIIELYP